MPALQKIFTLEVTPDKFLEACSRNELLEVDMLLNSERFQRRMKDYMDEETLYDKQVRERKESGLKFVCPPIFTEGINKYQMTCDDCPLHIKTLCINKSND